MSHPTRVRGLKCQSFWHRYSHTLVAPYTGAWIEIFGASEVNQRERESHPTRVRGLKFHSCVRWCALRIVAPYTGAWIEIPDDLLAFKIAGVAPYTGAWIEIIA